MAPKNKCLSPGFLVTHAFFTKGFLHYSCSAGSWEIMNLGKRDIAASFAPFLALYTFR